MTKTVVLNTIPFSELTAWHHTLSVFRSRLDFDNIYLYIYKETDTYRRQHVYALRVTSKLRSGLSMHTERRYNVPRSDDDSWITPHQRHELITNTGMHLLKTFLQRVSPDHTTVDNG